MACLLPIARCSAPALALPLIALCCGCLDDDRCGADQRRAGVRCIPLLDAAAPGDGEPVKDAEPACALTPTPDDLVGSFALAGAVQQSSCVAPLPAAGAEVKLEVAFSREGDTLEAQFTLLGLASDGVARIATDGAVLVTAEGNLIGLDYSARATLCFEALLGGSYEAEIALANTGGPLCTFSTAGEFARQ